MYGPDVTILLIFESHDMRHIGFSRLTVANGTPGNGASHIVISESLCLMKSGTPRLFDN